MTACAALQRFLVGASTGCIVCVLTFQVMPADEIGRFVEAMQHIACEPDSHHRTYIVTR